MAKEQVLDISWGTIVKIFIAIFIFYFIYLTKEIALWFFFAVAMSVILAPAVNFLRKLFDTSGFMPRWHCGKWGTGNGWVYILSDILLLK